MATIFVKLYVSLLIHRCIDLLNPLRIDRYDFLKIFVIPGGHTPPTKSSWGDSYATCSIGSRSFSVATPIL